ncbi:RsiV family protein [Porphyromonas crevioricanis]|uniref:RsiV family protein n=1 Tax=Porphyromonas crevioricanis TaxID=393921 RepID=UPI00068C7654|nr:RsiV family protein [Porphyromonas crevioricanis]
MEISSLVSTNNRVCSLSLGAFALLLWTFVVVGCNPNRTTDRTQIELDSILFSDELSLRVDADTPTMFVSINYFYPKSDKKLLRRFNAIFFGDSLAHLEPAEAMQVYIKYLQQTYRADNYSYSELADNLPGELFDQAFELSDSVAYSDSLFVCMRVSQYEEKGGAHESTSQTYYNINRENAEILSEQDLFVDGYRDELSDIIVACLLEQLGKKSPRDLENEGYFNAEEIMPNGNFAIGEKGLTYCFNEYEIAAYAMGTIYVFIPYERLQSILKPDAPIKNYLP